LQSVAECCRVLQSVVVCCSVLQCAAVCCSVSQCVAICCSGLQCRATAKQRCRRQVKILKSQLTTKFAVYNNYNYKADLWNLTVGTYRVASTLRGR